MSSFHLELIVAPNKTLGGVVSPETIIFVIQASFMALWSGLLFIALWTLASIKTNGQEPTRLMLVTSISSNAAGAAIGTAIGCAIIAAFCGPEAIGYYPLAVFVGWVVGVIIGLLIWRRVAALVIRRREQRPQQVEPESPVNLDKTV